MPAASEAVGSPGGGGGGGGGEVELQQFQIRNDEGFVYKVPSGLYPDAAPSTTTQSAAGPDRKAAGLRRRRRALLRLRDKRLRDLSRWEALASELLGPLQAPQPPASSHPVAAASSSAPDAAAASSSAPDAAASTSSVPDAAASTCSAPVAAASSCSALDAAASSSSSGPILDALLLQVDLQRELMSKAREWCENANAICNAQEAAIFDSVAPQLQSWDCNPLELMAGLCSPAADHDLDGQNGRPEASGVSSAAAMTSPTAAMASPAAAMVSPTTAMSGVSSAAAMTSPTAAMASPAAAMVSPTAAMASPAAAMAGLCCPADYGSLDDQNGRPEVSDSSSKMGHELPPTILTGSRIRKRMHNDSLQASITPKRKRASRSTSIASGTPGTGTRRTKSTPARAPFILGSPGALTRRRATARKESPEL